MLILCHLFGRRKLPLSTLGDVALKPLRQKYPSKIVLPALPDKAKEILEQHTEMTRKIFSAYAMAYAEHNEVHLPINDTLPLSGNVFPEEGPKNTFTVQLEKTAIKPVLRSPFVATSGHGDVFSTVAELCNESRPGLHLNADAIPSFDGIVSLDEAFKLNGYIYDFYRHGQVEPIVEANGIRRGDVWFLFQDFDLALKTIVASLPESLNIKENSEKRESEDPAMLFVEETDPNDSDDEQPLIGTFDGDSSPDLKVYQTFVSLSAEFNEKFRAMWA